MFAPTRLLLALSLCVTLAIAWADAEAQIAPRAPAPLPPHRYAADGLAAVLSGHRLRCGVTTAAEDYSPASTHGNLSGLGVDLCRATAAALLGSADAVALNGYPDDAHLLRAVREGTIDIAFGATPDSANALPGDLAFGPTAFFDGEGFMVSRASGITRPDQLAGKLLCFITGTSQEDRMNDWAAASGVRVLPHDFQERGEMDAALVSGSCAAIADNITALAEMRAGFHNRARDFVILPQMIAIDPWAPVVRAGQTRLLAVITDVLFALVQGEARHLTAAAAQAALAGGPLPAGAVAAHLAGSTPGIAATLGMQDGWALRAIAAGGHYGELFDRELGAQSSFRLDRGHNALWSDGGMLAMPSLR